MEQRTRPDTVCSMLGDEVCGPGRADTPRRRICMVLPVASLGRSTGQLRSSELPTGVSKGGEGSYK